MKSGELLNTMLVLATTKFNGKFADLRHNSDIRRLKGVTEKDIKRIEKYHRMYMELKELV